MIDRADALLSAWRETVARCAGDAAIFDTAGRVLRTFAEIHDEAVEFAQRRLTASAPGSVVAVQIGNHPSWPALLLACLQRALVVVPLERSIARSERDAAVALCSAGVLVTDSSPNETGFTARETKPPDWGERQPVLLKLTSGTTAAPRAIRFRSEQLVADCTQICDTMGITARDLNFAVIPVSHSYGFSNVIAPLLVRAVPIVLSRDRLPRAVLDDLARTNPTVFPGMPVFYQAFAEMPEVPSLPHLRLCISAGAPLPLHAAQKFRDRFGHAVHSFYGSSECGGICYDREAQLTEPGFVGKPMEQVEIELLDAGASTTRIRVRTAAAGDGYFPEPDEQKLGGGCFTPDDLLTQTVAGFRIVGRVSDVINVAGKKVNPAEVETVLLAFPGVREAIAFGRQSSLRNEEVSACVVADEAVREADLLDFCRHRLSGWQVPRRIFFLPELPVNERGKISRRTLATQFGS